MIDFYKFCLYCNVTFHNVFACVNQYIATDQVNELRTFDTTTFENTIGFLDLIDLDGKQIICVIVLRLYS